MDDLSAAVRDMAGVLNTGTPAGEPPTPFILKTMTGTITAISSAACSVDFEGSIFANIPFIKTGRTLVVGDVVFCFQLSHQRLVIGAISH